MRRQLGGTMGTPILRTPIGIAKPMTQKPMTAKDVRDALVRLGLGSRRATRLLGCDDRTIRRYNAGILKVPGDLANFLTRLTADNVSGEQAISALRDIE